MILKRAIADKPGQSLSLSFDSFSSSNALQVFVESYKASASGDKEEAPFSENAAKVGAGDAVNESDLLLYDVKLTNYLNGEEVRGTRSVDFATFASVKEEQDDDSVTDAKNVAQQETEGKLVEGEGPDADAASSDFVSRISASEAPLDGSTRHIPIWSVSPDIAVSTDATFNFSRLAKLRKRQKMFTTGVILPEGLTEEEKRRALGTTKSTSLGEGQGEASQSEQDDVQVGSEASLRQETEQSDNLDGSESPNEKNTRLPPGLQGFIPVPGIKYTYVITDILAILPGCVWR